MFSVSYPMWRPLARNYKYLQTFLAGSVRILVTESQRRKMELTKSAFAGLWGSPFPEELADEALSRTAHKISDGEQVENLGAYVLRIAHYVHLEILKREIQQRRVMNQNPQETELPGDEDRQNCYRHCLEALAPEERELIVKYYGGQKPPDRETLSAASGKTLSSLRVTAFRIRKKLAACLQNCVNRGREL
jgi:DNA-directed RNA polymerase specialized sigma24 family protein